MALSEGAMLLQVEPFWTWHTPISWTGYILAVDGVIWAKRRSSWLMNARAEFAFLALMSVPLWLIFEGYNLLIRNWHYINLPSNLIVRYAGYAWAFATIWPAIFETSELVGVLRDERSASPHRAVAASSTGMLVFLVTTGVVLLAWPIVSPSPYLAAPVWLGFIFLLDPLNARANTDSLMADWQRGSWNRLTNLGVAGFVCGILWEFWNYWARTKWIYTVPIMENFKIFEMPLPGYLGFPAFAFECLAMYVFVRRLLWRGRARTIGLAPVEAD
jgi:hypothetical protein